MYKINQSIRYNDKLPVYRYMYISAGIQFWYGT